MAAPACDDQVAHPGEPGEGLRARAAGLAEPRHFGQAAGDQPRLGVVAETQAVDAAGRERDHVLRCRTELDAGRIVARIDTKRERVERLLQLEREPFVLARDDRRGGQALRDLLGEVGAGEDRDGSALDELGEPLAAGRVEALAEAEHGRGAGELAHDLAEGVARHRHHLQVGGGDRRVVERGRVDSGQINVWEVARVPAGLGDNAGLLGVAAGEGDVVPSIGEDAGERRPPRAGSRDYGLHARLTKSIATGTPSRL